MRSPFTAEQPPPPEPPVRLDVPQGRCWAILAEQWRPDDEVRDRILVGMLARGDQSTLTPQLREHLAAEAQRVLAEHLPDEEGQCATCVAEQGGEHTIRHPCRSVILALLITPTRPSSPSTHDTTST